MGLAVLVCHLASQLSLEMTKEQILTSAALTCLSRSLWSAACCLPCQHRASLLACLAAGPLGSVPQAVGVQQKTLSSCPEAQAAGFIAGWWFYLEPEEVEGSGLAMGDNSQLQLMPPLCVPWGCRDLSALCHASHLLWGNQLVSCLLSPLAWIRSVTAQDLCLGALWDSWQGSDQGGRRKRCRICLCKKLF